MSESNTMYLKHCYRYKFDVEKATSGIINYIKHWFLTHGKENTPAIIGISGGKDSTVVAKLCVDALGVDNVFGVMLPNGERKDTTDIKVCEYLGIKNTTIDISKTHEALLGSFVGVPTGITEKSITNIAPRLRMTILYAIAQSMGGFVINTSNLSEDWIGWATIGGDTMGAFGPISMLTCTEVVQVGDYLGIPFELTHKIPEDGLTGTSDEEQFGFTYEMLDEYIRTGVISDTNVKKKIDRLHVINEFKLRAMDIHLPKLDSLYENLKDVHYTDVITDFIPAFHLDKRFYDQYIDVSSIIY